MRSGVHGTRPSATASAATTSSIGQNSTDGPSRGPPANSTQRPSGTLELDVRVHRRRAEVHRGAAEEGRDAARLAPRERRLVRARRERDRHAQALLPERLLRAVERQLRELGALGQRDEVLPALAAAQAQRERGVRRAQARAERELAAVDGERLAAGALGPLDRERELLAGPGPPLAQPRPAAGASIAGMPSAVTCQSGLGSSRQTSRPRHLARRLERERRRDREHAAPRRARLAGRERHQRAPVRDAHAGRGDGLAGEQRHLEHDRALGRRHAHAPRSSPAS